MHTEVRVRFAPSPTGHLHIGGLRTALFNYLFAHKNNGKYLLRIEDTDVARSTDIYTKSILDSFEWLGISADEPIVIQSSRFSEHQKVVDQLLAEKKAYRCYCSQEDLEQRLGKFDGAFVRYDRYCFNKELIENRSFVIRFVMPTDDESIYAFNDIIREHISFDPAQFDDFIIVRSDGIPVYNLVVVIDDAWMNISHVIRGEEHIPNTPKQIALYKACGYPVPLFAHLPMILGSEGQKLSKRDGAKSTFEYKKEGYLPQALMNYLVRLGWSHGDQEIFSKTELEQCFSLEAVGKKGAIFDPVKLDWMNAFYIKQMSAIDIRKYIIESLDQQFFQSFKDWSDNKIVAMIDLFKSRVATLKDLMKMCQNFFDGPSYALLNEHRFVFEKLSIKQAVVDISLAVASGTVEKDSFKKIALLHQILLVDLMKAVRIALVGQPQGPSVDQMIAILEKDIVYERLQKVM